MFPGDGTALSQVFTEYLGGKRKKIAPLQDSGCSFWTQFRKYFFGPYMLCSQEIRARSYIWKPAGSEVTWNYNLAASPTIPLSIIKNIKKAHDASFSAIILTAFGKALRIFLTEAGHVAPPIMNCNSSRAVPGHPLTLRNHL